VVIYPQSTFAKKYVRIAQTRLEQVLTDNGITVLDQKKQQSSKKAGKKLEDPGALITAEEFVKSAGKYDLDGVYRVYLDAALQKDWRHIHRHLSDRFALYRRKRPDSAPLLRPQWASGIPPSDGLSESAAVSNAIQRAIDSTIQQMGLNVFDFTNPDFSR